MRQLLVPALLILMLLASGCVSLDPTSLALASPAVSKFLEDYPNAEVKATHYTAEESAAILDKIAADCEKETVSPKEYYKVTITDEGSDLDVVAWVDVENQLVECVVKRGSSDDVTIPEYHECADEDRNVACTKEYDPVCAEVDTGIRCVTTPCPSTEWKTYSNACVACSNPTTLGWKEGACEEACMSNYKVKCYDGSLYWFDSCGNAEGKKEYCPLGCENDACVKDSNVCDVGKEYNEKPDCACPDGYEMIVAYPACQGPSIPTPVEEKTVAAVPVASSGGSGGVTGMPFVETTQASETYIALDDSYTTDPGMACGTKPIYKCVKREQCRSKYKTGCYGGHVYWYDSCGNVEGKYMYCENGCENGKCVPTGSGMYRYANWECYDGTDFKEGGETSCKTQATWRSYAEEACRFRCANADTTTSSDDVKPAIQPVVCGVKRFAVMEPCGDETECRDTDGGYDIYEYGTAYDGEQKLSDHCNDDGTLTEKYCDDDGKIAAKTVECPASYVCDGGECVGGTIECPVYVSPAPDWCANGTIVDGGEDENDCELPPKCEFECAGEGEMVSDVYTDTYPSECCDGMNITWTGMDTRISVADVCYATGFVSGAPVGRCIKCGNGVCGEGEGVCNCPEDCLGINTSTFLSVTEFCDEGYDQYCDTVIEEMNSELCGLCGNGTVENTS